MLGRLTKRSVESVASADRDSFLWDTDVKGFGLKVTPRGRRMYILQYRYKGRWRRYTIGRHGSPWSPDQARREAERLVGLLAIGKDPADEKEAAKKASTINELCDLYVKEGLGAKKPSTVATDLGRIERHIKPLIGKRTIEDVTRSDVEQMMLRIANGATAIDIKTGHRGRAIVRGGKGTATKSVALLGAIFTFAQSKGLRQDNPAHGVKKFQDRKAERFLCVEELQRLGSTLRQFESCEEQNWFPTKIILLLILTGCRKSEIVSLKWSEIDFERRCLRLADSKTGSRLVPLGESPVDVLCGMQCTQVSEWVFPNQSLQAPYTGTDKIWRTRIRTEAQISDVRLHDLRHTFASIAAELGYSQPTIAALLGHAGSGTTSRYVHFGRDPLGQAANAVSRLIFARLQGGADIVPIQSAADV